MGLRKTPGGQHTPINPRHGLTDRSKPPSESSGVPVSIFKRFCIFFSNVLYEDWFSYCIFFFNLGMYSELICIEHQNNGFPYALQKTISS